MLGVVLIGIHILPCSELTDETKIIVGLLCIWDIDTYFFRYQYIYLFTQREQSLLDNKSIFLLGMSLCFVLQTKKNNVLNHILSILIGLILLLA